MERKQNQGFEVRDAGPKEFGLFSSRDFKKGEVVYSYPKGRTITKAALLSLSAEEKSHLDKIGDDTFEVIGEPACFVNHSCEPNIEEKDRIAYALRDIQEGEELTIDYDKIAYLEEPFACHCGSKSCRGFVRGKQEN